VCPCVVHDWSDGRNSSGDAGRKGQDYHLITISVSRRKEDHKSVTQRRYRHRHECDVLLRRSTTTAPARASSSFSSPSTVITTFRFPTHAFINIRKYGGASSTSNTSRGVTQVVYPPGSQAQGQWGALHVHEPFLPIGVFYWPYVYS
jgi:hypothetical protein